MTERSQDAEPPPLVQAVTLGLIDATGAMIPIDAHLSYDPRDSYAATIAFITDSGTVRWTFGRDLLRTGLHEPSGDGDVHVWPCLDQDGRDVVIIELCSDEGDALVEVRREDLSEFVEQTVKAVEPGTESAHLAVDAAIAAILGIGAS